MSYFKANMHHIRFRMGLSSVSSVIWHHCEVRTWTWSAAEKSLSTAAELGRDALLFLKTSAMTGYSNSLLIVADLEAKYPEQLNY